MPPEGGIYQLLIAWPSGREITIGRLGTFWIAPGWYVYTGSMRRGLAHRLRRHAAASKPLRWHIDYLTTVVQPAAVRWWATDPARPRQECERHQELLALGAVEPIRGFGSSDCRCRSHFARLDLRAGEHVPAETALISALDNTGQMIYPWATGWVLVDGLPWGDSQ